MAGPSGLFERLALSAPAAGKWGWTCVPPAAGCRCADRSARGRLSGGNFLYSAPVADIRFAHAFFRPAFFIADCASRCPDPAVRGHQPYLSDPDVLFRVHGVRPVRAARRDRHADAARGALGSAVRRAARLERAARVRRGAADRADRAAAAVAAVDELARARLPAGRAGRDAIGLPARPDPFGRDRHAHDGRCADRGRRVRGRLPGGPVAAPGAHVLALRGQLRRAGRSPALRQHGPGEPSRHLYRLRAGQHALPRAVAATAGLGLAAAVDPAVGGAGLHRLARALAAGGGDGGGGTVGGARRRPARAGARRGLALSARAGGRVRDRQYRGALGQRPLSPRARRIGGRAHARCRADRAAPGAVEIRADHVPRASLARRGLGRVPAAPVRAGAHARRRRDREQFARHLHRPAGQVGRARARRAAGRAAAVAGARAARAAHGRADLRARPDRRAADACAGRVSAAIHLLHAARDVS